MKIQSEKIQLAQWLLSTENLNIIKQIKAMFESERITTWNEMPDTIKDGVTIGLKESEKGMGVTHKQAMKPYKKWQNK
ncbi:MAG: hypothetical protein COX70_04645 [Flavobacteriales bacterium CG_4_10_14_0_2_um_filter_32_8]|nr:MAG: hypothetical protein COX70_04645 [Flavobacteriales bacterium CG_4_10_14_0_2_um_filter_32_8]PJB16287.1 MAG: hypothetical protein CO118_00755 [Flavobacteriales bacterium CG_4_9_14_3_um_filter_32_8]